MSKKGLNIIAVLLFCFCLKASAQQGAVIDGLVNSGKGTVVIKSITKNRLASNDSALLVIRVFSFGCTQWKGGTYPLEKGKPYPANFIVIDSNRYHLGANNELYYSLTKGSHTLGITDPENSRFKYLEKVRFKVKKRRIYHIDCFVASPFPIGYH